MTSKKIPFPFQEYELWETNATIIPSAIEGQLRSWYRDVYPNNKWEASFDAARRAGEDFIIFYLKHRENDQMVASRNMNLQPQEKHIQEMQQILQSPKIAHGTSLYVIEAARKKGLAAALIQAVNEYMFASYDIGHIVENSRHVNALRLYQKCDAVLHQADIDRLNPYCPVDQNRLFFEKFLNDPDLNGWKFNFGIRYSYARPSVLA